MGLIFSIIGAAVTIGGVFIAVGVFKGKLDETAETNAVQTEKLDGCATKEELARAIERSDETLEVLTRRVEEDRIGSEQWRKEFLSLVRGHGERITALETMQGNQTKVLDKLEAAMNTSCKELREDLKELQRSMSAHG
jgi:hypothetical protein